MLGLDKDPLGVFLIVGLESSISIVSTCTLRIISKTSFFARVGGAMPINTFEDSVHFLCHALHSSFFSSSILVL